MSQLSEAQWRAEWAAAAMPKGPIKHVRVTLTEAGREGRAKVAGCGPQPTVPKETTCSLGRGRPQAAPQSKRRQSPAAAAASSSPAQANPAVRHRGQSRREVSRGQQQPPPPVSRLRPGQINPVQAGAEPCQAAAQRIAAEAEERQMIAKFHALRIVRVAAVSVSRPARAASPDHYGLRRHIEEQRRPRRRESNSDE